MSISEFHQINNNISQTLPSNPTGTTSGTFVQMGFAISFTPKMTGKIKISMQADLTNNTINDGCAMEITYGTGTAPINGAAQTGTVVGNYCKMSTDIAANAFVPGMCIGYVTGLNLATAIWVDAAVAAITGGTAAIQQVTVIVEEIQL